MVGVHAGGMTQLYDDDQHHDPDDTFDAEFLPDGTRRDINTRPADSVVGRIIEPTSHVNCQGERISIETRKIYGDTEVTCLVIHDDPPPLGSGIAAPMLLDRDTRQWLVDVIVGAEAFTIEPFEVDDPIPPCPPDCPITHPSLLDGVDPQNERPNPLD